MMRRLAERNDSSVAPGPPSRHQLPAALDLGIDLSHFPVGERVLDRIGGKRIDTSREPMPKSAGLRGIAVADAFVAGGGAVSGRFIFEWNDTHLRFTPVLFLLLGICCGSHMKSRRKEGLCHKGGIGA